MSVGIDEILFVSNRECEVNVRFIRLFFIRAATIHKSQGCTLTCAELMLENTFDFGQVYVALSRVKSVEGLWMSKPIRAKSIRANPAVLEFYRKSGDPSVAALQETAEKTPESVAEDVKTKMEHVSNSVVTTKPQATRVVTPEVAPRSAAVSAEVELGGQSSNYVNSATAAAVTSVLDFPVNCAEAAGASVAPPTKLETVRVKRVYTYKPRQKV